MSTSSSPTVGSSSSSRGSRKTRVGTVVSTRMMKTIIVQVDRLVPHPFYHRIVKRSARCKVHDQTNAAHVGDFVRIMETRPLSKEKRWRLVEVLRQGSAAQQERVAERERARAARSKTPEPEEKSAEPQPADTAAPAQAEQERT